MELVKDKIEILNAYGNKVPQIVELSKKVNQPPGVIILGGLVVWALFIVLTMGATILTLAISVLYPAFKSIQALETKDTDDDDKIWLTYWCVFGCFSLLDEFLGFILNFIPFYFYIKVGFFLWLMLPQTSGANTIYLRVLKPLLSKHKKDIEAFINDI